MVFVEAMLSTAANFTPRELRSQGPLKRRSNDGEQTEMRKEKVAARELSVRVNETATSENR